MYEPKRYLGIDTSNYTTSAASLCGDVMQSETKLLPVREGERGLRQSDAVFHHVRQLPELLDRLPYGPWTAVGVSATPRSAEGSYMPCFLSGVAAAKACAHACGVPLYTFSHQEGHVAAGIRSAHAEHLTDKPFLAFHMSGGTMELLHVASLRRISLLAGTCDLTAGQLIDRVGVRLGLPFPCGKALEQLAKEHTQTFPIRIVLQDGGCCLSGFENRVETMIRDSVAPSDIAFFVLQTVEKAAAAMLDDYLRKNRDLPILFVGGVSSNAYLKQRFTERYGAYFAEPKDSCDNASGIAYLTRLVHEGILV